MKKTFIVLFLVFVLGFGGVSYAGEVLYEMTKSFTRMWSNFSFGIGGLRLSSVAVRYTPIVDQIVCTAKFGLYKSGNPTDQVILNVREGGSNPSDGLLIRTIAYVSDQIAVGGSSWGDPSYTTFDLTPCLNLSANTNYFFTFSRTAPDSINDFNSDYYNYQVLQFESRPEIGFWTYGDFSGWIDTSQNFWPDQKYEPTIRLEGPNTKEPVIIVPGILGSRLNRTSDGEEVWPNIGLLAIPGPDNYLDELKLDSSGNEIIDINSTEIIERVLFLNQYGDLIQKFKDNGYELDKDLFIVPYDWRLDITTSSLELDLIIDGAVSNSPTSKVNLIAHSMGGLLVKDYLIRNGETNINKVIFAGTPHLGAPKAFNVLNWGDDFDLKFLGLGLNKNKAKDIAQNMPSVYQLLPSQEYFNNAGSYVEADNENLNYEKTSQFMSSSLILPDHRNAGLLEVSDEFHQSHDDWLSQSADIFNLMGCNEYDTIGTFNIDLDGSVDINSINGDGTVPLISAEHIPGDNYYVSYPVTKINHTGLISKNTTIDLLYDMIISDVPTLPDGIYKTSEECNTATEPVKRFRFSTHSPVNLHVYDSFGNHTGLSSDGNTELGIPESNFIQVGDNTFIFVLEGSYSIQIDAYATGSFDFKVKELINGEVQESILYNNVPIYNPNLEADFEFSGIDSSNPLDVDRNGDGIVDAGYLSDDSWMPYNATVQSTLDDLERVNDLGWIIGEVKNSLKSLLEASLPTAETIQSKGKKADGVLGTAFLKQLEMEYNKGNINETAFNIIKTDILWLLGNNE